VAAFGILAVGIAGCGGDGGPKYVKVSGVVKLNGVPYADAVVQFAPQGSKDNNNPGKSSSGYTDKDGRFILKISGEDKEGAVVGSHVVRIRTKGMDMGAIDPKVGSPDGVIIQRKVDPIPPEWNENSKQTFVVPQEGTDKADFDIVTTKKK